LDTASQDTSRVKIMASLSDYYKFRKPDSALYYGNSAAVLARKVNYTSGEVLAMTLMSIAHNSIGNYANALKINLQALNIAEKYRQTLNKAFLLLTMGTTYSYLKSYDQALIFMKEARALFESLDKVHMTIVTKSWIGETFMLANQLDSALYYTQSAYDQAIKVNNTYALYHVLTILGKVHHKRGEFDLALSSLRHSLRIAHTGYLFLNPNLAIAELYRDEGQPDSSIYYAKRSLEIAQESGFYSSIIDASIFLSEIYETLDPQKALLYSEMTIAYNDSLDYLRNSTAIETMTEFDEKERQYELESAKKDFQYRIRMNAFLGSSFTLLIIAIFLYRNNRSKKKAQEKIEKAYDQLKSTQTQLIQSEKMASLGELTAGIAHEIQNPLNFVNNFSELNDELLDELKEAITNNDQEEIAAIYNDLKENESKIKHHGQRAEGIVKGMLEHSRTSDGKKEPTDMNQLADEYLRFAYHGMRAKDKSFNADFKTEFDPNLPKINVVPQDIGRVLLNLINNAFYAVNQKSQRHSEQSEESYEYQPEVLVSTRHLDGKIEISVNDNGEGVPEEVRDKIFQPFFTTKPTGSGTGLGLSISYDIVKAHGGEIKVESEAGIGSEFIIHLPIV
jgi:signal transduction histidine kinase